MEHNYTQLYALSLRKHVGTWPGIHCPLGPHVMFMVPVSFSIKPKLMESFGSAWYISNTYLHKEIKSPQQV